MIDAHVHLDKGELSENWIRKFVDQAIKMKIDELLTFYTVRYKVQLWTKKASQSRQF
jgi:hypothetical protein